MLIGSDLQMSEKDGKSKEFLRNNERFADAFNYYMYNGEQVIKPDDLEERDVAELLTVYGIDPDGKINGNTKQRWRDLLKHAIIKSSYGRCYVLLGIENQSEIHYAMVVKDMFYDVLNYGSQVTAVAGRHRDKKDTASSGEFLSGFTKDDKLTPVITLTIYWGADEWDAPRCLYDMFTEADREAFSEFVSDYKLNLIVPNEIDGFGKFKTELGNVLEVIKASNDEDEMDRIIKENPVFTEIGNDVVSVINTFTGLKLKANMKGEKTDMCKAWEDHKNSGRIEGEIKGIERVNRLNLILIESNRYDDLVRSTKDNDFQTKLLNELVPEVN
jgi:hypothetical protein